MGGWQYSVDSLTIDFTNAWKNQNLPVRLAGKLRCPLFRDAEAASATNLFSCCSGPLGFSRAKGSDGKISYNPTAAFLIRSGKGGENASNLKDNVSL